MENTFDLKKFLVENKLTNNSKILSEVEQSVEIANNLKKIKVDAEAVISMAKKGIEDQEKYAGLNRDVNIDVQAVEQQIEVVEDALERIEDYAGDGWAVDIEDVAREKNIAELQNMLETLIEETDKLHSVYAGKPLQEGDLNEGWKQWALGAISALSVLGGGTAQAATYNTVDTNQPGIEMTAQQASADKAWEGLKSSLKSTNPMLIISKTLDTGTPFQSLGWGTASNKGTGEKGALAILHNKGSNVIEITFFSRTNPEVVKQLIKNANEAGLKLTASYTSNNVQASVPVDQAANLLQFIKTSTPLLKGEANQEKVGLKVGGSYDVGSNTGPMKAGPATTPQGSVKVGGKTFTGR